MGDTQKRTQQENNRKKLTRQHLIILIIHKTVQIYYISIVNKRLKYVFYYKKEIIHTCWFCATNYIIVKSVYIYICVCVRDIERAILSVGNLNVFHTDKNSFNPMYFLHTYFHVSIKNTGSEILCIHIFVS